MTEQDGKYLSKSDFAKQQGWSRSYISKIGRQGKLIKAPGSAKLIDVAATLQLLGLTGAAPHEPGRAPSGDAAAPEYWASKSRHEAALAKISEMQLAKQAGGLVDRKRVEMAAFTTARMTRDAILGVPTRLAPELAAMTDAHAIENKMLAALREVLAGMAKISASDLERAMAED